MKFYLEEAGSKRLLSQLCSSQIESSTVTFNTSHIHTNLPSYSQAPMCFTSFSARPFLLPALPSRPLSLLCADQGSACSVSISHVSFFPTSETLIQGQGLPSSYFPSQLERRFSGWPYLLSLLSQTLAGGGPLIPNSASLPQHTHHQHISVITAHTHTHIEVSFERIQYMKQSIIIATITTTQVVRSSTEKNMWTDDV